MGPQGMMPASLRPPFQGPKLETQLDRLPQDPGPRSPDGQVTVIATEGEAGTAAGRALALAAEGGPCGRPPRPRPSSPTTPPTALSGAAGLLPAGRLAASRYQRQSSQ